MQDSWFAWLRGEQSRGRGKPGSNPKQPGAKPTIPAGSPREAKRGLLGRLFDGSAQNLLPRLLILGALGVALMQVGNRPVDRTPSPATAPIEGPVPLIPTTAGTPGWAYTEELERKLTAALNQMMGVGNVHVMITLERSPEEVLAAEVTRERRVSDEKGGTQDTRITERPVLTRDDQAKRERPVVRYEQAAVIRGVLVVARGAQDPQIRRQIARAVEAVLGVSAHRVEVLAKE